MKMDVCERCMKFNVALTNSTDATFHGPVTDLARNIRSIEGTCTVILTATKDVSTAIEF